MRNFLNNLTIKQKMYSLNIGILIALMFLVGYTIQKVSSIEDEFTNISKIVVNIENKELHQSEKIINNIRTIGNKSFLSKLILENIFDFIDLT